MYQNNQLLKSASTAAITGAGAASLPNTSGNTLGTYLAYAAIAIGVIALCSQLIVRLVRKHYNKNQA